jgi:hypothetical protein
MTVPEKSAQLELIARRWMQLMRQGRFEDAWQVSDEALRAQAGIRCRHWPRHLQFIWDGTPLADQRVLVRCYHGLGDTIQYARFLPGLRAQARDVTVWVQPTLIPLLRTMPGIGTLLPLHDAEPEVAYDVDIEIMELLYALRPTLHTLPAPVPYIHVEPAPALRSDRLAVGLVWRSGNWDPRRSIPVELLACLEDVPNVDWTLLQWGLAPHEWPHRFGTHPRMTNVLDAAAQMRSLDLLICVDTFAAHLAGALAVPVWTLLHADADWRWMQGRADSPWYPTMRLFRQSRPGDWQSVLRDVSSALAIRADAPHAG